jgi:drug/metabolite transporter (DMT)-like permease
MGDGRVLALAAAACFALAAALQQKGQFRLAREGRPVRGVGDIFRLFRVWIWLAGTAVLLGGYALQGFALDVGKVVIVQPLLVTTLVFALPFGHWLTGQHVTRRQVGGAIVMVAGLFMFIRLGDPAEGIDKAPNGEVLVASVVVCAAAAVAVLIGRRGDAARKAALFGAAAGLLFGLSATFDKPAFSSTDVGTGDLFTEWEFWALVGFGVIAFGVQQLSLATGQLAPAMAAVSVANPLASTMIGVLIYEERLTQPAWHIALAIGALFVSFWGAVIVTLGNRELEIPGEPP